jgi:hypothetical protein
MRINEILSSHSLQESVSLPSTLRLLGSELGNPIGEVYRKLHDAAESWYANNRNMDGYARMRERSITAQWMESNGRNVVDHLHDLADQAPSQAAAALRRALRDNTEMNLRNMAETVAPLLVRIGKDVGSEQLVRNAQEWRQADAEYDAAVEKLKAESEHGEGPARKSNDAPSMSPGRDAQKDQEAERLRQQRSAQAVQVDQIVNSVLNRLPASVRGEIRNSISRDNNKLYALQRELNRRNIKLESRVQNILDRVMV